MVVGGGIEQWLAMPLAEARAWSATATRIQTEDAQRT